MKKLFLLLLMLIVFVTAASADEKLTIIATNFPAFDFSRQITQNKADVRMLLPPGSESHDFEPTPHDIISIQNCDLFVYTGGESDSWVENILESMGSNAPNVFRMSDAVTLLEEEHSESMPVSSENTEEEMDEHIWTSPKNVIRIIRCYEKVLSRIDPENAGFYTSAAAEYIMELETLDREFESIVSTSKRKILIFGDRFPFRYFTHDYHLEYDAAFPGCSDDSEPSVRTVISLIKKIRAEKIPYVLYIEFSSCRTASILAEETGAGIRLFHSCHNVSAKEIEADATYLTLMQQNAAVLREVLN